MRSKNSRSFGILAGVLSSKHETASTDMSRVLAGNPQNKSTEKSSKLSPCICISLHGQLRTAISSCWTTAHILCVRGGCVFGKGLRGVGGWELNLMQTSL